MVLNPGYSLKSSALRHRGFKKSLWPGVWGWPRLCSGLSTWLLISAKVWISGSSFQALCWAPLKTNKQTKDPVIRPVNQLNKHLWALAWASIFFKSHTDDSNIPPGWELLSPSLFFLSSNRCVHIFLFPSDLESKDGHLYIFISPNAASAVPQTWQVLSNYCLNGLAAFRKLESASDNASIHWRGYLILEPSKRSVWRIVSTETMKNKRMKEFKLFLGKR